MKTMTIELERPATIEVLEFELPYFAKFNNCYYAVIDPLEALRVYNFSSIKAPMIDIVRHSSSVKQAFAWEAEPIEREEFFRVYNEALLAINEIREKL
jgi:hypothetical protein